MRRSIGILTVLMFFLSVVFAALSAGMSVAEDSLAAALTQSAAAAAQPPEEGKISLDLKGMDIVEAIKMLASKGNLNIVLGTEVKGRVTMFLKDVNVMDAFDIILVANGLACDKRGGIIYVMNQRDYEKIYGEKYADKREVVILRLKYAKASDVSKALSQLKTKDGKVISDDGSNTIVVIDIPKVIAQISDAVANLDIPTVTKIFEFKYAKVADLKDKINENLTKGVGMMQLDERTNKIAVTDTEKKIADIEKIAAAFDEKVPQVLIEAKILQITLDDRLKLGVEWDSVLRKIQREISLKSAFQLATYNAFGPPGAEILIGSLGGGNVNTMIQVLKTIGDTDLLSSPRITAINNQEAKILVGTSQPYATNTVTQTTGTATTGTNISFLDIGIKLFVTPTINKDGLITMKIRPEVSSSSGNYTYGTPSTTIPIVQTTQAETSVRVKDGATIVIGGLIKDERIKTVNKIPILGDLPLIKYAFSNTDSEIKKQELVIFLTPHIISGTEDYLEPPVTPPIEEKRFTMTEAPAFERREPAMMDPTLFKKPKKRDYEEDLVGGAANRNIRKVDVAASTDEYYYALKNSIIGSIALPKGKNFNGARGKVRISFFLTPDGKLARGPDVMESSNHKVDQYALNAVKRAAPFSPFPESMGNTEKRFIMDFNFE